MSLDLQENVITVSEEKMDENSAEIRLSDKDQNEHIYIQSIKLKNKKKKPFIMVKTGMQQINEKLSDTNLIEKPAADDEESYLKSLLNDQSLVETDILQNRPSISNMNPDIMSNSGSSVVITPTNGFSPSKNFANSSEINDNFSGTHNANSNDLNYSDSDFESNLIGRLDKVDDERDSSISSNSSNYNSDEIIRLDSSSEEEEVLSSTTSSSDEDEDLMPVNPATLDRNSYYAMQKFQGPESSHSSLQKNEECVVLNDEDVYWWLVRRVRDGRIGFVPGELLEGWNEKLAAWNTFINERQVNYDEGFDDENPNISNTDVTHIVSASEEAIVNISNNVSSDFNKTKSFTAVKFDENVTYVPYNSHESVYSGSLHEELNLDEDYKSDVSWSSMPKLQIKKHNNSNKEMGLHKNISTSDDVIWKPERPFVNNSQVSSPSIGEYSTSVDSMNSTDSNSSSSYSDNEADLGDNLHQAVSSEYDTLFAKMDDLIKRLK
ncbi:hypothetical protein QEN19_004032 [Hanseniaspora menglaensis]